MRSQYLCTMVIRILLCLLLASSTACSWLPVQSAHLLTSCSDSQLYVAQQQWQVRDGQQQYLLQVAIERGADHWQWVLMDNLGQRLVTARAKAGSATIEQHRSHPASKLLPELLDAWQFSYWPLEDLQRHKSEDWRFSGDTAHREVWFSGIVRASVVYQAGSPWVGKVQYSDKQKQFDLIIESQLLNTP
ncbi:MAG TPA: DUF3261 domain-containing protein [Cellvibrio sp.]|nr:DUF3261 domain-containing protein [Cellvibrio sp.]